MDDFEGAIDDPSSLHKYLYASGNPGNRIDPTGNADYTDVLSWAGLNGGIQAIPVLSVLKVIGFVTSGLLIGVGLGAMGTVITANRTAARELTKERTRVKEEVESKPRPPKSKILFHYTNAAAAQQIFATGELRSFRRGTFGFGNYATDQAGWLAVEIMTRSRTSHPCT